jgi:pimeloyl-ACP methyl ester carboxylesterase
MWAGDFALSVTRARVRSFTAPVLVLRGVDDHHPAELGCEVAALAPGAELIEPWKDPGHLTAATKSVGRFPYEHTPT